MDSKEITPMQSFMEKVQAKLRDDIGEMLPDEALKQMVEKVINDEFFTKKKINQGIGLNPRYVEKPSQFEEMVISAAEPLIQKQVAAILRENSEKIDQQIKEAIGDGILQAAFKSIDSIITGALWNRNSSISCALDEYLRSRGIDPNKGY